MGSQSSTPVQPRGGKERTGPVDPPEEAAAAVAEETVVFDSPPTSSPPSTTSSIGDGSAGEEEVEPQQRRPYSDNPDQDNTPSGEYPRSTDLNGYYYGNEEDMAAEESVLKRNFLVLFSLVMLGLAFGIKSAQAGWQLPSFLALGSSTYVNAPWWKDDLEDWVPSGTPQVAKFVFLVGVEGAGHHMFQSIYKESPAMEQLEDWNIFPNDVERLHYALYHDVRTTGGLFSAPCPPTQEAMARGAKMEPDGKDLLEYLVSILKDVNAKLNVKHTENPGTLPATTAIALNSLQPHESQRDEDDHSFEHSGMMTYPNGKETENDNEYGYGCRLLQYPNLDLLYKACDLAGVDCVHAVIFRDAHKVIQSTVDNRNFEGKQRQIVTLTEMLHIIEAQLQSHPNRLAACWDFDSDMAANSYPVAKLFGWNRMVQFSNFYQSILGTPSPLTPEEKLDIVPDSLRIYMTSMENAMDRLAATCDSIYQDSPSKVTSF
mmetsp:Transcript_23705/g.42758  ORF Transcript_23705/g.42758 Transcript_23705/m.42758 type:complete len:487 (-) Transcript_23705:268-1728(-)|eukprot:CAMPEP_0198283902 /NCGR_PEP_ID=MMETSP1449-20131203/3493_1 /TAXON_ID=420275 /ORGANISM="Attheya septentrionalis, Strain CCMP2084" /LENGTH=486 /DNA_ID=CAMNT_0043980795 /DNA_START=82 /DNA_END=1542 /DNA_ORIENTATION=+